MHISEGILSGPVLAGGAGFALAATAVGLKKMNSEQMVHTAILASSFFVASLIHVNIGPGSVHLILNGLIGLLLGLAAIPAILTALALQAILFQYGGLTGLGINLIIMALPAVVAHYCFAPFLGRSGKYTFAAGFGAGSLAIFLSALLMAGALWFTDQGFMKTAWAIVMAHVPVMIIEGIVTGFCVSFLMRVYPEILPRKLERGVAS
ncbi:MAG: cobalt transporter CbiM [Desulfobacterales bacterium]|nr:cobalt transporter CbiM [Desulfobacterales bacterium]